MKKTLLILAILSLSVLSISCGQSYKALTGNDPSEITSVNSGSSVEAEGKPVAATPSIKIIPVANNVYHGAFVGDQITEQSVASYETMTGQKLDIGLKFFAFTLIDQGNSFPAAEAQIMANRNGVIYIKLEPWSWNVAGLPTYSLTDIIAGKYDYLLQRFATGAKAYGKPVFVTFGHEMNATWYPWGGNPSLYVQAYRYVYNKVSVQYGASNITWVWTLDADSGNFAAYYPGSDVVDWIALDGFNTEDYGAAWRTESQIFSGPVSQLQSYGKPIMIGETACDANNNYEITTTKPQWLYDSVNYVTTTLNSARNDNLLKGCVYFDVSKVENSQLKDWAIDTTVQQSQYATSMSIHKSSFRQTIQTKSY